MKSGIALRLRGVVKSYGERPILRSLSLDVPSGQFVAVVGRSGCGKSTLLRLIAGLTAPDEGAIVAGDHRVTGVQPDVRMIFQEARLLPWNDVLANVGFGTTGIDARARDARARTLLEHVGLADRAAEWPGRLSGGQRQRVALARGLMSEPRLLLLDEPLGALDALTRIEMQQLIERLWREHGFTAVLVTHEVQEAVALADRVIILENGSIAADVAIPMPRPRMREDGAFVATSAALLGHILQTRPAL
ncbi:ATP-binding cassette domain-containing protein [Pendulispora albinea]|uniref:ATP-binding cassette domain-containing protein n=1 Tax=Pendulispora albinea TaxID=2741071 RepID=A0ABZ2LWC0_9BACT